MKYVSTFLIIALFITSCSQTAQQQVKEDEAGSTVEEVSFTTSDGFLIKGSYYVGSPDSKDVILLHMMGRDRSTWNGFAELFNEAGYNVLSIDLRGHGESVLHYGETRRYGDFSNDDFSVMINDVAASKQFMQGKAAGKKIILVGASIGANVALNYAVDDSDVEKIVLLSPGIEYKGIETKEAIVEVGKRPVLIIVGEDDTFSYDSGRELKEAGSDVELRIMKGPDHGTNLFDTYPALPLEILKWVG